MRWLFIAISLLMVNVSRVSLAFSQTTDRPNILFIAVDDLRPSIGCYGDPLAITPNMDRLAGRGLQFNRAYCQVAVCNPSRASLMTGQRPDKLGVWTLPIHFREAQPDAVTMPQWFRKFGYTAVSHGKIYHNPTPDPQSWSEPIRKLPELPYPYPVGTKAIVAETEASLPAKDWRKNNLRGPSTGAPDFEDSQLLDGAQTDLAIEDLRRLGKQSQPFFLAMGYIRPHLAFVAPKKYWDLHDSEKLPVLMDQTVTPGTPRYALANNSELSHYVDLIDMPKPWDEGALSIERARDLMHGYYACVSYVDAQIGRLLTALDEEGLADNTIVVLWSDHGWKLGEHRGWGKMTNYEIDARVPLIISAPGSSSVGVETDQLVELLDLFPTLCELAKIDTPEFVDGKSLASLLSNSTTPIHDAAVSQYYRKLNGREYMGYSLRTDAYRMIEWRDFATGEVTERELYDHRTDHSETVNLATTAPDELISQLTELLLQDHPRIPLVMTPKVHSERNEKPVPAEIVFVNQSDADALIYPIDVAGRRGKFKKLMPGKKLMIKSQIGKVFVVENSDGKLSEIHSPSISLEPIILK